MRSLANLLGEARAKISLGWSVHRMINRSQAQRNAVNLLTGRNWDWSSLPDLRPQAMMFHSSSFVYLETSSMQEIASVVAVLSVTVAMIAVPGVT